MTGSLEDLVRETLAARAHDVDGVELTTPPAAARHGRRWIAIGTVAAVAAAIVVAVVLVAPRSDTARRGDAAVTPAAPPTGMQWVSYHGLTLTVPDTWALTSDPCAIGNGAPGLVTVDASSIAVPCAASTDTPAPVTVTLDPLVGPPSGTEVTVDGQPAFRTDTVFQSDPSQSGSTVQLPGVSVTMRLYDQSADTARLQSLIDSIEYTPVDHHGCAAQQPSSPPGASGSFELPEDIAFGVVCEYGGADLPQADTALIGSRELTSADLAAVRSLVDHSTEPPQYIAGTGRTGPGTGLHVYLLSRPDGSTLRITVSLSGNPAMISNGARSALLPYPTPAQVPEAYPN